jgi:hypothetical protein
LSELGQDHASACALEQPTATLFLEVADLPAHVRLACPVGHGDLAETAELGRVDEKLPCGVIQGCLLSYLFTYI